MTTVWDTATCAFTVRPDGNADDKRQPCRSMVLTGQIFLTLCLHELALLAVGETYGGRYGEDQVTFLITREAEPSTRMADVTALRCCASPSARRFCIPAPAPATVEEFRRH